MKKPRHVSMLGLEYGQASHPSRQLAALLPFPGSYPGFFVLAAHTGHSPNGCTLLRISPEPQAVKVHAFGFWRAH